MKKFIYILIITILFIPNLFIKTFSNNLFWGNYNYKTFNNETINSTSRNEEVLLIIDYSNSMNGQIGYTSKLIMTMEKLKEILSKTKSDIKIGLRIFGYSESSYKASNTKSLYEKEICNATKLIVPIEKNNTEQIVNAMNNYTTRGASPIGASLREAIKNDFSISAKTKHIILITDGNETCGDDPCIFIKNLMSHRNDIKIDVIGITLKKKSIFTNELYFTLYKW